MEAERVVVDVELETTEEREIPAGGAMNWAEAEVLGIGDPAGMDDMLDSATAGCSTGYWKERNCMGGGTSVEDP